MVHSFLMIGQSNMAGRGSIGEAPPIENENLFMLRNGRWYPLSEPVNYDRPFAGVSLAVSFADEYQKKFGGQAGLIPCADGGSSLEDWREGGQLYTHAVYQCRLAKNISEVRGILWHQGEADSGSEEKALSYGERFIRIIKPLLKDCGIENAPLILGELGYYLKDNPKNAEPFFRLVNRELARLAAENGNTALASAEGLVSKGDYLHFDSPSLREFGRRYFQKFLSLSSSKLP
ncbi:MAG: sialate O-acetylesterase [Treponema sp.]|nr:sialate O-acetylesterase [Treponema sp.]